ncbi:signal transduction histidine kinase [Branchiibius hedensis]|uniref:histidine kinase n=1 Tax=Branchiibius hedensis TaxID=672460 RepID=A0A2Y9C268_9MICO|nr:histidine kinase [Branchiibius hedensis]PWJ26762.1 signal transduction histidine kinase [Branchiibius hedensis]SSA35573.1 Signal transduction histidine kinase [Branchiibius hedensis]
MSSESPVATAAHRLGTLSPSARDGLLALGCLLIGLPEVIAHGGWNLKVVVALVAMSAPVLVQSRYPVAVFAVLSVFAAVQWWLDVRVLSDVSLLVVLTTLVVRRITWAVVAAVVILEVGVILAVLKWSKHSLLLGILLNIAILAAVLLGVYLRERSAHLAQLTQRAEQLERARIARDMHDVVGHHLAVMIALADGAQVAIEHGQRPEEALRQLSATGRQALAETRSLVTVFASSTADVPAGLEQIAAPIRLAGVPVRVHVDGPAAPGPGDVDEVVRRVVQEALTNTLKHAQRPASVEVTVTYAEPQVTVDVTDRGARRPLSHPAGRGISGMAERVAAQGGRFTAGPHDDGWRVHATLPVSTR